ncbi:MAG: phage integrase family protein [Polaromonas sp.]
MRRLGPHHFAHLRACAECLGLLDSARRYLGTQHGHEAAAGKAPGAWWGSRSGRLRARRDRRGRLSRSSTGWTGLAKARCSGSTRKLFRRTGKPRATSACASASSRKRCLERRAAETPQPGDSVAGWFDDALAAKLVTAGLLTLGDLNARISMGGRWFATLPAVGIAKARRIERHLATLLPRDVLPAKPLFALNATPALFDAPFPTESSSRPASVELVQDNVVVSAPDRARPPTLSLPSLLGASSDLEAVQRWIQARAGSITTACGVPARSNAPAAVTAIRTPGRRPFADADG